MLAAERTVEGIRPVFLLKTGTIANSVFIRIGEVGAVFAQETFLKTRAGVAAFTVNGNNGLIQGAHALFTVKAQIIRAFTMFHD